MKKISVTFLLVLSFLLSGCSNFDGIEISGSTSITPLMNTLSTAYQKENNIAININADGSSAGIKAASLNISDIGMSSRELKDDELELGLNKTLIAYDAIGIVVNKGNKISELTSQQLYEIFSGKIRNWKYVGGIDLPIVVVSREDGSGTRIAFEEIVGLLNDDGTSKVNMTTPVIVNSSGATIENVKQKIGAIGYVSAGSISEEIKSLKIDSVFPISENIRNKKYKLARNFYLLSKDEKEETKKFIEFILSEKGQVIVNEKGYTSRK